MTGATMTSAVETKTAPQARAARFLLIATGIASVVLLASHPDTPAATFADVLKNEAGSRLIDAIVHGGFILVLALQLVGYAVFTARLGPRISALAGFVFFAVGAAFLSGSMLIDGLLTPAVAAKYLPLPDKIDAAKTLFVFMGLLIRVLMPLGLAFQSAAIATWGWALVVARMSRLIGVIGMVVGGVLLCTLLASAAAMNPIVLMGAVAAMAVWAVVVGVVMVKQGA